MRLISFEYRVCYDVQCNLQQFKLNLLFFENMKFYIKLLQVLSYWQKHVRNGRFQRLLQLPLIQTLLSL